MVLRLLQRTERVHSWNASIRTLSSSRSLGSIPDVSKVYGQAGIRVIPISAPRSRPQIPPAGDWTPQKLLSQAGRKLDQYSKHFTSWEQLFNSTGEDLAGFNIGPKDRKSILFVLEKFRQGQVVHLKTIKKPKVRGQADGQQRLGRLRRMERKERRANEEKFHKHANEFGIALIQTSNKQV